MTIADKNNYNESINKNHQTVKSSQLFPIPVLLISHSQDLAPEALGFLLCHPASEWNRHIGETPVHWGIYQRDSFNRLDSWRILKFSIFLLLDAGKNDEKIIEDHGRSILGYLLMWKWSSSRKHVSWRCHHSRMEKKHLSTSKKGAGTVFHLFPQVLDQLPDCCGRIFGHIADWKLFLPPADWSIGIDGSASFVQSETVHQIVPW